MTNPTKNEITGDPLINKPTSDAYRSNYDRIFRLTKEQQAAMDDTAGIEEENDAPQS